MSTNKAVTIGCIGMTHLGLVHALAFAEKGYTLVCYDENSRLIEQLKLAQWPINEPGFEELARKNQVRLQFTDRCSHLNACDIVFISYDVPTDDEGQSHLRVIYQLLKQVIPILNKKTALVLLSQVPPGFTRQIDWPKEQLFYQVETLIFGRAMERALYPERYIVGVHAPHQSLTPAYAALLASFQCPILTMRYESAELAKISINLFLISSVSTTNTLAEICENVGADWEEIAPALRLDKRIGPHAYLSPGLGIAGGNLERDLATIVQLGHQHEANTEVVQAWLRHSRYCRDWVLRCLATEKFCVKAPIICMLGLAYKPNTHSIKNSPSIALISQLKDYKIQVHDPIVSVTSFPHVIQHQSIRDVICGADIIILMTPWSDYQTITWDALSTHMRGNIVIDPYRLLPQCIPSGFKYFSLGQPTRCTEQKEAAYV